jgi:hypothetical protein
LTSGWMIIMDEPHQNDDHLRDGFGDGSYYKVYPSPADHSTSTPGDGRSTMMDVELTATGWLVGTIGTCASVTWTTEI